MWGNTWVAQDSAPSSWASTDRRKAADLDGVVVQCDDFTRPRQSRCGSECQARLARLRKHRSETEHQCITFGFFGYE
jgi:hypothetical protein